MKKTFVFILTALLLSGCGLTKELNELSVVIGAGIDYSDDGYAFTYQVLDPAQMGSSGSAGAGGVPVFNIVGRGATIGDAIKAAEANLPRQPFHQHLSLVILGENLARKGTREVIDLLERNPLIRSNLNLLVAQGQTANQALNALTPLTQIPSLSDINKTENNQLNTGHAMSVTLIRFIQKLDNPASYPLLSGIQLNADPEAAGKKDNLEQIEPKTPSVNGMAVFSPKGSLLYWLDGHRTKYSLLLKGMLKRVLITYPCDGSENIYRMMKSSSSLKMELKDGKPELEVNVHSAGELSMLGCKKTQIGKHWDMMEKDISAYIKSEIIGTIRAAQKKGSDYFGFSEGFIRKHPEQKDFIVHNGENLFKEASLHVTVQTELSRPGLMIDPH